MASSDNNIKQLRKNIDVIDSKLVDLLNRRAATAIKISESKKKNSYNIYDPKREREIFGKLKSINKGPLSDSQITTVFRQIISVCREIQKPITVSVLGPIGSYTHQTAQRIMGDRVTIEPLSTIDEVFTSVENGLSLYGVVPIENSIEGSVGQVLDRLIENRLRICAEYYERISHCILSRTGNLRDIKIIASHPQALGQCRKSLSTRLKGKKVEYKEVSSTASAAQLASQNKNVAAIAGEINSKIYGLKIIEKNVEDSPINTTRFILIGFNDNKVSGNDKTSIVFSMNDEPGALSKVLLPFEKEGINLTKIESRPSRTKSWNYVFFADFTGHSKSKSIRKVLNAVGKSCIFLKVLGSYPNTMDNI